MASESAIGLNLPPQSGITSVHHARLPVCPNVDLENQIQVFLLQDKCSTYHYLPDPSLNLFVFDLS